jgi:transposase
MIGPSGTVRVLVATGPVDFCKGAEGLAALVRETFGADPFSNAISVFRTRRADRLKLLFRDGTGVASPPLRGKAHPPLAGRADRAAHRPRNRPRRLAVRGHQDDACPLAQPMFHLVRTRQTFEFSALTIRQENRSRFQDAVHPSLNHDPRFSDSGY